MKSNGKINFNIIIYIVIVFMLGYLILHYDDFNFTGMDILGLQFDKKEEGDGIDEKELEYKATDVILNDSIIVELPTITSVPIQVTTMPTLIPLEYTAKPEDNEVINFLNEYGSNLEIGSYNFSNAWYTDGNRDYKIIFILQNSKNKIGRKSIRVWYFRLVFRFFMDYRKSRSRRYT